MPSNECTVKMIGLLNSLYVIYSVVYCVHAKCISYHIKSGKRTVRSIIKELYSFTDNLFHQLLN